MTKFVFEKILFFSNSEKVMNVWYSTAKKSRPFYPTTLFHTKLLTTKNLRAGGSVIRTRQILKQIMSKVFVEQPIAKPVGVLIMFNYRS